jgi:heme-degrading monooxygenase HmoA
VFARTSTFQARPDQIDAGIAYCRDEVMPLMQGIDGYIGLSMIVDRESGRCIATSAWESEEAMKASADALKPVRDRAAEMMGATTQVDEWEIGGLHRDHPTADGACTRVSWMDGPAGQTNRLVEVFRNLMPTLETWDGFCSASLLVNDATGRCAITTTWESREALEQSRAKADQTRAQAADDSGTGITEVEEFELAIAHLRVPELV